MEDSKSIKIIKSKVKLLMLMLNKKRISLLKKKKSKVVVGINRGVCASCHMSLPTQIQVSCKAQSEIVNCSNCGRIVYFTRDMELNL